MNSSMKYFFVWASLVLGFMAMLYGVFSFIAVDPLWMTHKTTDGLFSRVFYVFFVLFFAIHINKPTSRRSQ